MILGGVFDRHPTLQIIIGHMGEATSFMLPRFDATLKPELTGLRASGEHLPAGELALHLRQLQRRSDLRESGRTGRRRPGVVLDRLPLRFDEKCADVPGQSAPEDDDRASISHRNAEQLLDLYPAPFSEPVARTSVSLTASPCDRSSTKMGPPQDTAAERLAREDTGYHKSLKNRQIQMIALGGAIGTGLFLGAGGRLASAGPGSVHCLRHLRHLRLSDPARHGRTRPAPSIVGIVRVLRARILRREGRFRRGLDVLPELGDDGDRRYHRDRDVLPTTGTLSTPSRSGSSP